MDIDELISALFAWMCQHQRLAWILASVLLIASLIQVVTAIPLLLR